MVLNYLLMGGGCRGTLGNDIDSNRWYHQSESDNEIILIIRVGWWSRRTTPDNDNIRTMVSDRQNISAGPHDSETNIQGEK